MTFAPAFNIKMALDKKDERRFKRACRQLPEKVFKKHVGRAAKKAMTPVSRAAKKAAPKDTGDYRKSIGKKGKSYPRSKVYWVGVGPRKGYPNYSLGHLIEFGHRMVVGGSVARISGRRAGRIEVAQTKERMGKGTVIGFVPPRPHLRPALRRNGSKALALFRRELQQGILKEARMV